MGFNKDYESENSVAGSNGAGESTDHFNQFEGENMNIADSKKSGNKVFKRVFSTVAAGVVGSALTLTALPYTSYFKNLNAAASSPQPVTAVSQTSSVAAKPTSAQTASSGSIADMVAGVSKAIVGIENYQQQNSNNDPFGNSSNGNNGYGGFGNSQGSSGSADNSQATDTGSGIIFEKSGNAAYIVTNNHVVEGASKITVSLYNGQQTSATLVGTDALTDLAVLKIDSKYVTNTAQFGNSSALRPGDPVYAIGNPLGLDLSRTVTSGIVSAVNRTITVPTSAGDWDTNVIQTDAAINPGNSGGALINDQGLVMGINSSKISETGVEGIGFAIPSNDAVSIINQLIKNGKIERPYLGVGLEDLSQIPQTYWKNPPNNVTQGVMITNVDSNSAAARSGFKAKDVIVSMNGKSITSSTDLREYLYTKVKIGDMVNFGVYRNGQLIHISVKLSGKSAN